MESTNSMGGMSGMAMSSTASPTTMSMGTASPTSTMDMGGMDMGSGECKVSMLWNWNTIDACFISSSWHIDTAGQFAGTCIGIFAWVVALQAWMRLHREYDRWIVNRWLARGSTEEKTDTYSPGSIKTIVSPQYGGVLKGFRVSLLQQLVRAGLYSVEFGAGYLLMLMAMYYNGYVLISGFIGGFVGYFLFGSDTVAHKPGSTSSDCC